MAGQKAKAKARKAEAKEHALPAGGAVKPVALNPLDAHSSALSSPSFEHVEMKQVPHKGVGMFAKHPIAAGTVVFEDRPIMVISKHKDSITEYDVRFEYNKLTTHDKHVFDSMYNCHGNCGCKSGLFFGNIFSMNGDWNTVGCFPYASRFNHSCLPNIRCLSGRGHDNVTKFETISDIETGTEITFPYCPSLVYMHTQERKEFLAGPGLNFDCKCSLCQAPADVRLVSDMRRKLMRQLIYWMTGKQLKEVAPVMLAGHKPGDTLDEMRMYDRYIKMLAKAEGVQDCYEVAVPWFAGF